MRLSSYLIPHTSYLIRSPYFCSLSKSRMIHSKLVIYIIGLLFVLAGYNATAQVFPAKQYPQGYFRDPLDIPINLSGNFGELRPGHFHMGTDIKTMARVKICLCMRPQMVI